MTTLAQPAASPTLTVSEEIHVRASVEDTFDSLIVQMGRQNQAPDGSPLR